ncbi:hypothetical protein HYW40_01670 [Candidatus Curtissbacteria bacterium]|nr:hypothetical protein [Candidatus Curtissbacteria bacterium]
MTTNYKIAVAVVSTLIVGLALFGIFLLFQKQVKKPGPSEPLPAPSPASGFELPPLPVSPPAFGQLPQTGTDDAQNYGGISIETPTAGSLVTSPLQVKGQANTPQGSVSIVVKNGNQKVIGQGKASACFAKNPCPFSASVVFEAPETQTGTIEAYSPSPKNGSKEYLQIIRVNF